MTRIFRQRITCPKCRHSFTVETNFSRWIRKNPLLDSTEVGTVGTDEDGETKRILWHRYKTEKYGREVQCMMILEIKENGSDLTPSQRDTLCINNQLIRNRRSTPNKKMKYQKGNTSLKVYSTLAEKDIYCRHFGHHVIRFSHTDPIDSKWIEWDHQKIDTNTLVKLLRFDLDPDNLQPLDIRNRHWKDISNKLPGME